MVKENCEHCGRFLGTYHKELTKDTVNIKKRIMLVEVKAEENLTKRSLRINKKD